MYITNQQARLSGLCHTSLTCRLLNEQKRNRSLRYEHYYLSPSATSTTYSQKDDAYALGVLLYEMAVLDEKPWSVPDCGKFG